MVTGLVAFGIALSHILTYSEFYSNMFISFAGTYAIKRLIKSANASNEADLIGLAGYSITLTEFAKLLNAVKKSGFKGNKEASNKIVDGLIGQLLEAGKEMITK